MDRKDWSWDTLIACYPLDDGTGRKTTDCVIGQVVSVSGHQQSGWKEVDSRTSTLEMFPNDVGRLNAAMLIVGLRVYPCPRIKNNVWINLIKK